MENISIAQGQTANKWQRQKLKPGSLTLESMFLTWCAEPRELGAWTAFGRDRGAMTRSIRRNGSSKQVRLANQYPIHCWGAYCVLGKHSMLWEIVNKDE